MAKSELENERKRLEKSVQKRMKRLRKSLDAKGEELSECSKKELYEQMGNLLACHFQKVLPGMREVVVENLYGDGGPVAIVLDPKKSPKQNVSLYFTKAKKLQKRLEVLPPVIRKLEEELSCWKRLLDTIAACQSSEELHMIREKERLLESPKEKQEGAKKSPFHEFFSASGLKILVGKDAESNDLLTFQKAAGDDIWLHAHGCPGSHVVIRKLPGGDVDRAALMDAMQLALYFSKRRSGMHQKHEVLRCRRRDVKKRRGAPKGEVMTAGGSIERIELDPALIAEIKARKRP